MGRAKHGKAVAWKASLGCVADLLVQVVSLGTFVQRLFTMLKPLVIIAPIQPITHY